MKRLTLLMTLMLACSTMFAQKHNRTTAFNFLRSGDLDRAKEFIDKTIHHPQTMEDARTWFYRGNIYLSIHMSANPEYKALDNNALDVAVESYVKAKTYDSRKHYYTDILTNLFVISEQYYNRGVAEYNEGNFKAAMNAFKNSVDVTVMMGSLDTMAMYNVALTAEIAGENTTALKYYNNLLEMGFKNPEVYASMGRIHMAAGDTTTALNYILDGRQIFPDEFNLLIQEINVYLLTKNVEKAIQSLELAVMKDDTNPTIFFAAGVAYDQLKTKYPDAAAEYFAKAEAAYQRAIELNPEYFDPAYNLGALHVNEASMLIELANKLPLTEQDKYVALTEKAHQHLTEAMPNLERAHKIQPNDFSTMVSLKEIYVRLNKFDKVAEIDKKIKKHQERE